MTYDLLSLCFILAFSGVLSGVLAGLLGVGGGVITVLILFACFDYLGIAKEIQLHSAIGTSLALIVITSLRSSYGHYKKSSINFTIIRHWAVAIITGSVVGSMIIRFIDADILRVNFGLFCIFIAIYITFFKKNVSGSGHFPALPWQWCIAAMIGFLSSLMGIGGGMFSVAVLVMFGLPIHKAVGTSAAFGFLIALPATIGFMISGYGIVGLPPYSVGYVSFLPIFILLPFTWIAVPWGVRLSHAAPQELLKWIFGICLFLSGLRMLMV